MSCSLKPRSGTCCWPSQRPGLKLPLVAASPAVEHFSSLASSLNTWPALGLMAQLKRFRLCTGSQPPEIQRGSTLLLTLWFHFHPPTFLLHTNLREGSTHFPQPHVFTVFIEPTKYLLHRTSSSVSLSAIALPNCALQLLTKEQGESLLMS